MKHCSLNKERRANIGTPEDKQNLSTMSHDVRSFQMNPIAAFIHTEISLN